MTTEAILSWLDTHPSVYWAGAAGATLALIMASLLHLPRAPAANRGARHRWLFPLLMLVVLLAWRWPYLLYADELNTDESQFIAGALTLSDDPLFWRSVDGMTAGPLVYYALLPWTLAGLPLTFLTARLTALLLLWLTVYLIYRTIRDQYDEKVARLGLLPGVLFLASVYSEDLNHYSSELVSLPLTAAGLALLCPPGSGQARGNRHWFLTGLVAGLLPWVKLQAGPIGAVLVIAGIVILWRKPSFPARLRLARTAAIVGGALLPAVAVILITLAGGVWLDFFRSYILQNLIYAGEKQPIAWLSQGLINTSPTFLTVVFCLGTPLALILVAGSVGRRPGRLYLLCGPLFVVALLCVLYPGRNFLHYTMLLVVPLAGWSAAALGECWRPPARRLRMAVGLLAVGLTGLLAARVASPPPPVLGQLLGQWTNPNTETNNVIDLLTEPGERLAVWGWHAQSYVKNGLRQGTRGAFSYWSIREAPLRAHHRATFLADFRRNRPEVLLDSVGPNSLFFQDRATEAHEIFPELAALVQRDYALVIDLGYARIFARRDVLQRRHISSTDVKDSLIRSRSPRWLSRNLAVENLRAQTGSHHRIGGRDVLMMLPPSKAVWTLKGDEREVFFQTGYDPRALAQPEGNGTEFVLELQAPDGKTRTLQSFVVNPQQEPADRLPRNRRMSLPPYEPGSRLVLRSTPGANGDDAWDWAYITNIRFLRSPHFTWRQFPGFNRMPDFAHGPLTSHVQRRGRSTLLLHAPADFGYLLQGHERHLSFTYGFIRGAQTRTNGASIRVEGRRPDGSLLKLAERRLRPATNPEDRTPKVMKLTLPELPAGTQLTVAIDPDGNNAFDWTYVTNLWLD